MLNKALLSLPFDQYSRQMQVLDIINSIRPNNKKYTILDVGGYKGATSKIHKDDTVTVLDVFDVKEKGYIKGDALDMSFGDSSFDFVVSFDVLEHIAENDRDKFIHEISRVAKVAAIVAAPTRTEGNSYSEDAVNRIYKKINRTNHPWLKEHIDNGLPNTAAADKAMRSMGLETLIYPSNDTQLWLAMQGIIFIGSKYPEVAKAIGPLNTSYNKLGPFDGGGMEGCDYRNILVGSSNHDVIRAIESSIENTGLSFMSKLKAQNDITNAYLDAIRSISDERDALASRAMGLDHACQKLSGDIRKLKNTEQELKNIKESKAYRLAKSMSRFKSTVKGK